MTIEENLRKLIREKYLALTVRTREKAAHKRIYPDSIADYYEDYYQALEDALRVLVGADAVKGFNAYYKELETALINEAKTLQLEFDVNHARKNLTELCKRYPSLSDLLSVMSYKDVIRLEKNSHRAMSLLIDDIEDFEDEINAMRDKYKL